MLQIFIGTDERQPIAFTALSHSIIWRSSMPVSITPLVIDQLPIKRRGITGFTYSRYLVPWLMKYTGTGLFLDADMIVQGDIAELFSLFDPQYSVQVVQNKRQFEWPSMMLFNCAQCKTLTPEWIEEKNPYDFSWAESIGDLPAEWNHCIGYDEPKPAKLLHYTTGIPIFEETKKFGYIEEWKEPHKFANSSVSWTELMSNSVHAEVVK